MICWNFFLKKMASNPNEVRLAFIVDKGEENLIVVDIKRIQPISSLSGEAFTFILETEPFFCEELKNGAGPTFSDKELKKMINYLENLLSHKNNFGSSLSFK